MRFLFWRREWDGPTLLFFALMGPGLVWRGLHPQGMRALPERGQYLDIAFSPSEPLLACVLSPEADSGYQVQMWNTQAQKKLWTHAIKGPQVQLSFSPNGQALAGISGGIAQWEAHSGQAFGSITLPPHASEPDYVGADLFQRGYLADGQTIEVRDAKGNLDFYDAFSQKHVRHFSLPNYYDATSFSPLTAQSKALKCRVSRLLGVSPDGNTLVIALYPVKASPSIVSRGNYTLRSNPEVWLYDLQNHFGHRLGAAVGSVGAFSRDGRFAIFYVQPNSTPGGIAGVQVWDLTTYTLIQSANLAELGVPATSTYSYFGSMAFSPDGNLAFVGLTYDTGAGKNDTNLMVWDLTTGEVTRTISLAHDSNGIEFKLSAAADNATVAVMDTGQSQGHESGVEMWRVK